MPEKKQYEVKLYHPKSGLTCQHAGQSERMTVPAHGQGGLRKAIETSVHGLFTGEYCRVCGSRAQVTVVHVD